MPSRTHWLVSSAALLLCLTACARSTTRPADDAPAHQHEAVHSNPQEAPKPMHFQTVFSPDVAIAGTPVSLTYRVTNADGSEATLVESHTKRSHLIVVRSDLSGFQHVHPAEPTPGTFAIDLTLPLAGRYVLFADATPAGGPAQVHRFELEVTGPESPAIPLQPGPHVAQSDGYDIAITPMPDALQAGGAVVTFAVSQSGAPVDLVPYLGALGHLVIISEDTTEFLHAHPEESSAEAAGTASFGTAFPHAGRYRAWLQFQTDTGVHTASFVLDVGDGPVASTAHGQHGAGH